MGRLVRVGSYYNPPPVPQLWGKWRPYTLSVFAAQIPGTVAASDDALDALHLKYKVFI